VTKSGGTEEILLEIYNIFY